MSLILLALFFHNLFDTTCLFNGDVPFVLILGSKETSPWQSFFAVYIIPDFPGKIRCIHNSFEFCSFFLYKFQINCTYFLYILKSSKKAYKLSIIYFLFHASLSDTPSFNKTGIRNMQMPVLLFSQLFS